ncbi:MAG TPA: glycosyltransferase family 1 protein [Candidatus Synoicihabitans sp.]|nr:glycosyltransferase family 1 protein [Candidatus Synoicihabitans sp.]
MLLLDLTHTSHTTARTGIQRVCRELHRALTQQEAVTSITHDRYQGVWRRLASWETANLSATRAGRSRGSSWPIYRRWSGRIRRSLRVFPAQLPQATRGIVVPEIFSAHVARALPTLFSLGRPRVALFHDAIPLRLPEHTPPQTVARFPSYLQELARFDGIAAVSEDSRAALVDYWNWVGFIAQPPVVTLPLGTTPRTPAPASASRHGTSSFDPAEPVVLCVGSIEGRKNHLVLFEACETLWAQGAQFKLRVIGMPRPETARAALTRMQELQHLGRPLIFDGPVDERTLNEAYAECAFTVYPSLMEGFGLPVIESLQHGRPCVCSSRGALGESARSGGCVTVDPQDPKDLARAIGLLLHDDSLRQHLTAEASARRFRTWEDYVSELSAWMSTLATSTSR